MTDPLCGQPDTCLKSHPVNGGLCVNDKGHGHYHLAVVDGRDYSWPVEETAPAPDPTCANADTEPQTFAEWKLLAEKLTDEIGELREDKTVALTAAMLLASKMAKKYYPETPGYKPPAEIGTVLVHIEDMLSKLSRTP